MIMFSDPAEENRQLKAQLWQLRQAIIRADPAVMHDGRFEEMFTAPVRIIDVARQVIEAIPNGTNGDQPQSRTGQPFG
ncbi:MAG: hypothetical protein ACK2UK_01425 [Candidatus Promineifilaceae bacterium]|jgi:hypothetical protein